MRILSWRAKLTRCRFVDSEKWRKDYAGMGVEELVRTFNYKERPQVFEYYPQYYHKTDKVSLFHSITFSPRISLCVY
jgi:hypothetical protein